MLFIKVSISEMFFGTTMAFENSFIELNIAGKWKKYHFKIALRFKRNGEK